MKCTCKVGNVKTYGDAMSIFILYCPKHAAVDDLLAAAKMALEEDWYRRDIDYYEEWLIVTSALRTAIAKAEPQP